MRNDKTNLFIEGSIIRHWKSCLSTSGNFIQEIQDCNISVNVGKLNISMTKSRWMKKPKSFC